MAALEKACRHTRRHGVFTIGLAAALAQYGLGVAFHSRKDSHRHPIEVRLYRRALRLGVALLPATSLRQLVTAIDEDHVPIVFYNTRDNVGHFSPLLGARRGRLLLPNTVEGTVAVAEFERGWRQPGILQQAIVVTRLPNKRLERTAEKRGRSIAGR